ncbi:Hypothetical predicted protein [Paramuricea clavata]|uniref:Uncharacterized protein n=1 Tax=Paramuricea clavata TaxID=317549 RepID=A0A6S7KCE0_PARCT|nr:Hypothetical predicted protein [Paramuricea clavata]
MKEVLSLAQEQEQERDKESENDPFENLLQRHDLLLSLRILAWVRRFSTNRHRRWSLTSDDVREVRDWWTKRKTPARHKKERERRPSPTETRAFLLKRAAAADAQVKITAKAEDQEEDM